MNLQGVDLAFLFVIALHVVFVLAGAVVWLTGSVIPERVVASTSVSVSVIALVSTVTGVILAAGVALPRTVSAFTWFSVASHDFPFVMLLDRNSLVMATVSAVTVAITSAFSSRYLHKEPGLLRFFLLLHMMAAGASLVFLAGSLDVLVLGWELLGISSTLLIAFYERRAGPVHNAVRVFCAYRIADIGLLTGVVAMHHSAGSTAFLNVHAHEASGALLFVTVALLLWAAAGKSALVPFSSWLCRAMEGPTPSSAIFYGALSVHAGAFLMLRIEPLIAQSPLAQALCVLAGAITSLWASNAARAACDAKSAIALATSTQLGLIFVEIGLGLTTFALIHMMGNAIVRLVQFLRAPSVLLEHQQIHDEAGGQLAPVGKPFRVLVPEGAERIAYALAVNPHNLDAALDRLLAPLLRIGRALDSTLSHK